MPKYEKANILGANWFTTEWYPSRQLACSTDEAFFIAFANMSLFRAVQSFPYASETKQ